MLKDENSRSLPRPVTTSVQQQYNNSAETAQQQYSNSTALAGDAEMRKI